MQRFGMVALGVVLFWSAPGVCQGQPSILASGEIDVAAVLSAPPAADSAQTKSELAEVHRFIREATPERRERAKREEGANEVGILTEALGYEITKETMPKTWQMFRDARREAGPSIKNAKDLFKRARPFQVDVTIEPCTQGGLNASYPSAHSIYVFSAASLLSALVPEKAAAIDKRANEFTESRMICGMHFRSDVMAGKTLGTHIATALLTHAAFKAEFDEAVAEIAARSAVTQP